MPDVRLIFYSVLMSHCDKAIALMLVIIGNAAMQNIVMMTERLKA